MFKVKLVYNAGDERSELFINDFSIVSANYDEHGSAGMQLIEIAGANLVKFFGAKFEYEEV